MTDNQYREVDPYEVAVSDMNERRDSPATSSIQESIEQQGVIQPPLVRERDDVDSAEVPYEAVVGQRRVLGAQAASGIDTIPVVVVGWDDAEAIYKSISENVDEFRESVAPKDRATAILRAMELNNHNQRQAADEIGVSSMWLNNMIERGRDEWTGTALHVESDDDESKSKFERIIKQKVDEMADGAVANIRQATGGGEKGEKMAIMAAENELSRHDIDQASARVRRGENPEEAIKQVAEETNNDSDVRCRVRLKFTGDAAEALETAATQWGATENQVARKVILRYLDTEGFLGGDGS